MANDIVVGPDWGSGVSWTLSTRTCAGFIPTDRSGRRVERPLCCSAITGYITDTSRIFNIIVTKRLSRNLQSTTRKELFKEYNNNRVRAVVTSHFTAVFHGKQKDKSQNIVVIYIYFGSQNIPKTISDIMGIQGGFWFIKDRYLNHLAMLPNIKNRLPTTHLSNILFKTMCFTLKVYFHRRDNNKILLTEHVNPTTAELAEYCWKAGSQEVHITTCIIMQHVLYRSPVTHGQARHKDVQHFFFYNYIIN